MLDRERRERDRLRAIEEEREHQAALADKTRRIQRRGELQAHWNGLARSERQRIESAAYEQQNSETLRRLFLTSESHRLRECLKLLDRELTPGDSA